MLLEFLLNAVAEDVRKLNTHHPRAHKQYIVAIAIAQVAEHANEVVFGLVFRFAQPVMDVFISSQRIGVENRQAAVQKQEAYSRN